MPNNIKNQPSITDISILNILRCEPPTLAFNFFEYGGLTRSVFSLLQDVGDLEAIISENRNKSFDIPSSSTGGEKKHTLLYEVNHDSHIVVANTHNNFSNRSDLKFLGITPLLGIDEKIYQATSIALEVYREKGNQRPIWAMGFYITGTGSKDIVYGEEAIIEMPETSKRVELIGRCMELVLASLNYIDYNPIWTGIINDPNEFKYLKNIMETTKDINVITKGYFEQERTKWFRYLAGTLDVKKVFKFEDSVGYVGGFRAYRVELTSTHLDPVETGRYKIRVLATTERFPQIETHAKDVNAQVIEFRPYSRHRDALTSFLKISNHYLRHIHIKAGLDNSPFIIPSNFSQTDFKYVTIIKDADGVPITISSWETPYRGGVKLPSGQVHHYLQLWDNSANPSAPLYLHEGIYFPIGQHPRTFMGKLLRVIPQIRYKDGSAFLDESIRQNILLRPAA